MKSLVSVLAITILVLFGGLAGACSLVFLPDVKDVGELVFLGFAIFFGCLALARLVWLAGLRSREAGGPTAEGVGEAADKDAPP